MAIKYIGDLGGILQSVSLSTCACIPYFIVVVQLFGTHDKTAIFQTFDLEHEGQGHLRLGYGSSTSNLLSACQLMPQKYVVEFSRFGVITKRVKFRQFDLENEG